MWDDPWEIWCWPWAGHLEDGEGLRVVVQDGVGLARLSPVTLKFVADLDGDVGKAVILAGL